MARRGKDTVEGTAQPMGHTHTRGTGRIVLSQILESPQQPYLLLVVDIQCPVCEISARIQIPGIHLGDVADAIAQARALHPELCGPQGPTTSPSAVFVSPQGDGKAN